MNTAANFPTKSRVRYLGKMTNYKGVPYKDQLATVIRPIKSRNKVTIEWDMAGQPLFDAKPENLELLVDNPPIVRNILEVNP